MFEAELQRQLQRAQEAVNEGEEIPQWMALAFPRNLSLDIRDFFTSGVRISLACIKDIAGEIDLDGRWVLPHIHFSQAKALQFLNPLKASYLAFEDAQKKIHAPLLPFLYLENLAFDILTAVSSHALEDKKFQELVYFLKAARQQAEEAPPDLRVLSVREQEVLGNTIVIVLRLSDFLRSHSLDARYLQDFLKKRLVLPEPGMSCQILYQEFCARQNPIRARGLDLMDSLINPVDQRWQRYQASSGYLGGQIGCAILLLILLGLLAFTPWMPGLPVILPVALMVMLHWNISPGESLGMLSPQVTMPLKVMMGNALGTFLVEEQLLGIEGGSSLLCVAASSIGVGLDIVAQGFDAHLAEQEKQKYIKAGYPQHQVDHASPLKEAKKAGLYRALHYSAWMGLPYLFTRALLSLLSSDHLTGIFEVHWPTVLNPLKLLICAGLAGKHFLRLRKTEHPVSQMIERHKVTHFALEAFLAGLYFMKDRTVFEGSQQTKALVISGTRFSEPAQPPHTGLMTVNGASRWNTVIFSKVPPDALEVDTPSDAFDFLAPSQQNRTWLLTPFSLAQGMGAPLVLSEPLHARPPLSTPAEPFWAVEYFGKKQCPADIIEGAAELMGSQKLGILSPLSRSPSLLLAQGIHHQKDPFGLRCLMMSVPPQNLQNIHIALHQYPQAMAQVFYSLQRGLQVELKKDPMALRETKPGSSA